MVMRLTRHSLPCRNPFFQVWQLRGRYPNRNYPKIFNDQAVGAEAKKLFDDAQQMLKVRALPSRQHQRLTTDHLEDSSYHQICASSQWTWSHAYCSSRHASKTLGCDLQEVVDGKLLQLKGIVGIYPANSAGDDVEVYADEGRQRVQCRFFGLRQQAEKENEADPYMCISDFIAPKASGVPDYLGLFANGTFGVDEMVAKYKADVGPLLLFAPPTLGTSCSIVYECRIIGQCAQT